MRKAGSEGMGIDTIVASGIKNTYPILARTSHRQIQKGDMVLLTIAPRYEGYHGALGRPVVLGKPTPEVEFAMNVAIEAQMESAKALKPGAIGSEIDHIVRSIVKKAGLEKYIVYSPIHSVGVVEFEPPILSSSFNDPIKENMIFSIDIPLFFTPWGGLRYEDGFHVTSSGARRLQKIVPSIITI
jgi:Xaa-Pro dipeptidase